MDAGRLTPLQCRLLNLLAEADSGWVLGGGGALAGVFTRHRETRDLYLFWRECDSLGDESGGNLERAVLDAPRKDGGFSPLTLAWSLRNWDIEHLARSGTGRDDPNALTRFRDSLVQQLLAMADPRV